jgi:DNA mismatch repair protein MutS2
MFDHHAMKVLEFDEVKDLIAGKSHGELGRTEVMALHPLGDLEDIDEMQNKVRQVIEITEQEGGSALPLGDLQDLRLLHEAASKGITLSVVDFLQILKNIRITAQLKRFLNTWTHLPYISEVTGNLNVTPVLERTLGQTFDSKGTILDSASPELRAIRDTLHDVEDRIHRRIGTMLRDLSIQKMFQEQIITLREGRYVIPIKQEFRGIFPGLVLDTSGSGATVFMEPLEVVEQNNELRQAHIDEKREIEHIMKKLTELVSQSRVVLSANLRIMGHLDMVGALALFALESKAILPAINATGHLQLRRARHPLLGKKAVPIDIELGRDFSILIVTGPNTGGKTVTLKTTGLFSVMGLSGMPIPADEGSEIPFLSNIFADIGDEQSIAQNLSTFSSHMSQIIRIMGAVDSHSLILLDELGAGTDPKEGTALGIAVLEHLASLRAKTVVTTHYGELKYFASTHPQVRNAAMEFDSETLMPSYRIAIGLPGRSCALSIAGRLGLPPAIQKRAESLVSQEYLFLDRLLADLKDKQKTMEEQLTSQQNALREAMELKSRYEDELFHVKTDQTEILTQASSEAEVLLHSARSEIRKSLKEFRKRLSEFSRGKPEAAAEAEALAQETMSSLDKVLERLESFKKRKALPSSSVSRSSMKPGDLVLIPSMDKKGEVLEVQDEEILIQVEKVKLSLPFWKVVPLPEGAKKEEPDGDRPERVAREMPARLDLRGHHVDEALYELEKHIDEAILTETKSFQIIHGKGTGALRKAIQYFLKRHPAVADYRLGESHEGSWGVTVVSLE